MSTEAILGLLIGGVLVPLIAWNVVTLIRVNTVLFGADGSNGLNGRVKALETAREDHATQLALIHQHHQEARR